MRLENWRHAQEHGAVVGRNAAGGDAAYNTAPSFWSEQYDLYIQGVGWQALTADGARAPPARAEAMLLFELDGAQLTYAMGINVQRDIATIRRLIERRMPVDASDLADPGEAARCNAEGEGVTQRQAGAGNKGISEWHNDKKNASASWASGAWATRCSSIS